MAKIIEVQHIAKKFLIANQQSGYGTLVETLSSYGKRALRRLRHPFTPSPAQEMSEFWSLEDISFDVEEGDRLGIIGRNGAGKSTLLKILSRITYPTKGRIKIRGRVASLLEVGTGFHPELTGRENIFLNGAILGMKRREIVQKFDEIVAFSEIGPFLDTPVKRYSSGMYTRLGFAIAAHIDPDILIVDEVLAVGDTSFQKKCIQKMNSLGSIGKTVLFVSHDIGSMIALCNKGVYLSKGRVELNSTIENCVNCYLKHAQLPSMEWQGLIDDENIEFKGAYFEKPIDGRDFFYQGEKAKLHLHYNVKRYSSDLILGINIYNTKNQLVGRSHIYDDLEHFDRYRQEGEHHTTFTLDAGMFLEGDYRVAINCFVHNKRHILSDQIGLKYTVYPKQNEVRFKTEGETIFLGSHWQKIPSKF